MSRDASIEFVWGDGLTRFALRIGGLRDLEAKRKAGAVEIFRRFENETWFVDDVYEVIRLGLIGGGKIPTDAYRLTEQYVAERPIVESFHPAYVILASALNGAPEDDAGKQTTATTTEATSA